MQHKICRMECNIYRMQHKICRMEYDVQNGLWVERKCGSNTDQTTGNTHMVGTCESLYSANTSLGAPTITMDLARISVTPSLNLHCACIISTRQTILLLFVPCPEYTLRYWMFSFGKRSELPWHTFLPSWQYRWQRKAPHRSRQRSENCSDNGQHSIVKCLPPTFASHVCLPCPLTRFCWWTLRPRILFRNLLTSPVSPSATPIRPTLSWQITSTKLMDKGS